MSEFDESAARASDAGMYVNDLNDFVSGARWQFEQLALNATEEKCICRQEDPGYTCPPCCMEFYEKYRIPEQDAENERLKAEIAELEDSLTSMTAEDDVTWERVEELEAENAQLRIAVVELVSREIIREGKP